MQLKTKAQDFVQAMMPEDMEQNKLNAIPDIYKRVKKEFDTKSKK
jgi:hypothetical protein